MTYKFKPGDRVRRLDHPYQGLVVGHVYTVHRHLNATVVEVVEAPGLQCDPKLFELVNAAETAKTTGRKDDSGKLDMTLLDDMPRAVQAVVQVMQWAVVDKRPVPYERGSWQGVHADRYRAAIQRHMRDAAEQDSAPGSARGSVRFQRDRETNLLHLAHVATSALMALENTLRELESHNV